MLLRKFAYGTAMVSALAVTPALMGCASQSATATATTSRHAVMVASRRLTESEYRHTVTDAFGDDIKINGRFETDQRDAGLLAVGSAPLSISASGFEQYFAMAKSVSDQVFDAKHRDKVLTCKLAAPADAKPADSKAGIKKVSDVKAAPAKPAPPSVAAPLSFDDKCAEAFVRIYGEKLFRRPLTEGDIKARVALAKHGAEEKGDFYSGMKLALISLLTAPEFAFRLEMAEPDPAHHGQMRLDSFTRAERLSYLLWDAPPDAELTRAAKAGELQTQDGLNKQVERMAASPRLKEGARAFFTDMLELDGFDSLTKDATIYPKYSQAVADSAEEQTLRTMVDLLITRNSDYRDIFTSRDTFINRPLASVYQVPLVSPTADWVPYTFAPDSDRAGIQTEVTFLSLFSHPGRSSPTKRGVALNEIFLCTPTPPPPANVDFSIVNNTSNPDLKTVRARLLAHAFDDTCAACHNLSDPIGLSLEHFDSIGQYRKLENGDAIDVSVDLKGVKFAGAAGLGQYLRNEPRVPSCIVNKVFDYGVGRAADSADKAFIADQIKTFESDGYHVPALIERVAESPAFYRVIMPKPDAPAKPAAKPASKKPAQVAAQSPKRPQGEL